MCSIVYMFQRSRQDQRTAELRLTFMLQFLRFHPYLTRQLGKEHILVYSDGLGGVAARIGTAAHIKTNIWGLRGATTVDCRPPSASIAAAGSVQMFT